MKKPTFIYEETVFICGKGLSLKLFLPRKLKANDDTLVITSWRGEPMFSGKHKDLTYRRLSFSDVLRIKDKKETLQVFFINTPLMVVAFLAFIFLLAYAFTGNSLFGIPSYIFVIPPFAAIGIAIKLMQTGRLDRYERFIAFRFGEKKIKTYSASSTKKQKYGKEAETTVRLLLAFVYAIVPGLCIGISIALLLHALAISSGGFMNEATFDWYWIVVALTYVVSFKIIADKMKKHHIGMGQSNFHGANKPKQYLARIEKAKSWRMLGVDRYRVMAVFGVVVVPIIILFVSVFIAAVIFDAKDVHRNTLSVAALQL